MLIFVIYSTTWSVGNIFIILCLLYIIVNITANGIVVNIYGLFHYKIDYYQVFISLLRTTKDVIWDRLEQLRYNESSLFEKNQDEFLNNPVVCFIFDACFCCVYFFLPFYIFMFSKKKQRMSAFRNVLRVLALELIISCYMGRFHLARK